MYFSKIFVLSGPSGVGKTTLLNKLFQKQKIKKNFIRGISFTTRKKRPKEVNGKDYFFVDKNKFLKLKKENFFLETQKVLDDYYGTPKYFFELAKNKKKNLILCIDVKGGMYLKKKFNSDKIITIFISPPKEEELYKRLKKRAEDIPIIEKKTKLAKKELKFSSFYDYLIVNKNIEEALKKLEKILLSNLN